METEHTSDTTGTELKLLVSEQDYLLIKKSFRHLEHPSLAARLSNAIGTPIELAINLLPKRWHDTINKAAHASISKALDFAITSLQGRSESNPRTVLHRGFAGMTGAAGGMFGLPALALEMPVTTSLMLRSIAEIARSEGEDLSLAETRLACMQVFALGARSVEDNAADTGYYGVRMALSLALGNARQYVLQHGFKGEAAPLLLDLVHSIASRFGIVMSEKAAAQAMPVIGAVGGATINVIFMNHFQDVAKAHFTMRRLERLYGQKVVQSVYDQLLQEEKAAADQSQAA